MKMTDILKKYVLPNLPYLIFLWFFAKVGEAVRLAPGVDASTKLLGLADGFTLAFQTSMPGAAVDWLIGLIGAAVVRLVVYVKGKNAKKYRKDVEYGSARWGTKADIAPFMDPKPENNIILTQTEGLMMSGRPKNPAYARNKNVLVVWRLRFRQDPFFHKTEPDAAPFFLCSDRSEGHCPGGVRKAALPRFSQAGQGRKAPTQ